RVEKIEVGQLLRQLVGVGQPGRVVLGRVARDRYRRVDSLLERGARKIRGAGVAAAHLRTVAEVHRDAERAVAVVLDGVGLALAHRDREAVRLGHVAVAAAGAGVFGALKHRLREALQLGAVEGEAGVPRRGLPRHMPRYDIARWSTKSSAKR